MEAEFFITIISRPKEVLFFFFVLSFFPLCVNHLNFLENSLEGQDDFSLHPTSHSMEPRLWRGLSSHVSTEADTSAVTGLRVVPQDNSGHSLSVPSAALNH